MIKADRTGTIHSAEVIHGDRNFGVIVYDSDGRGCAEPALYVQTRIENGFLYARLTGPDGRATFKETRFHLSPAGV